MEPRISHHRLLYPIRNCPRCIGDQKTQSRNAIQNPLPGCPIPRNRVNSRNATRLVHGMTREKQRVGVYQSSSYSPQDEKAMNIKSTWETFFDAHAPAYDGNVFTKNTSAEVDFLLDELKLPAGAAILDVGCGTGRHSIELARRGYAMTGLDLSSEMLARAVAAAKAAAVSVAWIHADAARFALPEKYDAAICLCEGSIGLLGQA